ncbi:GtrA family protein [Mucilaginibacter sp.]|uniref:GtrA family protein n=1 Tax=Mucilaginibacter sp. TaxID=1882438 RepID=UPI00262EC483|nr:GtrA family protein [Mucilaginibacter sp.]MDB5030841.1 GtrA family protein [Mucilaginibacter sp.]
MANNSFRQKLFKNQVARFVFSAGAGFLVDIFAFYMFYHNFLERPTYNVFSYTFDNYTLSLAISFFLGVVVNFLITRYMVFNESVSSPAKQFIRFVTVAIIGFFANLSLLDFFIRSLHMYPPMARVAAALSLFFASFFVHKFFSFSLSLRHHAAGASSKSGN